LKFDRSALQASIRAGIASHAIDTSQPVVVHLYSGARDLGSDSIQVKE
jgi:hypothetical protein